MARYNVQATHTPEECLKTLDDIVASGQGAIDRYDFACAAGDHSNHVAYTTVEAASDAAAREQLPASMRAAAMVTEVGRLTAEQVRSFHT
jgi:hypothetical protein